MSVELLRRAANLMREQASLATPSPWRPQWLDGTPRMPVDTWAVSPGVAETSRWTQGGVNADYIASWHPDVALAVADLLDREADEWDNEPDTCASSFGEAIWLANTYLGESA